MAVRSIDLKNLQVTAPGGVKFLADERLVKRSEGSACECSALERWEKL